MEKPEPQYLSEEAGMAPGFVPFCPPKGTGGDPDLNLRKNRIDIPKKYRRIAFNSILGLQHIKPYAEKDRAELTAAQKAEIARWEGIPVAIEGFIKLGRKDTIVNPNFIGAEEQRKLPLKVHS